MRVVKCAPLALLVPMVLALIVPANALASRAFISVFSGGFPPGTFMEDAYYLASPGETNNLTVNEVASGTFRLHDSGATITAGFRCTSLDPHTVVCNAKRLAGINLGDQDDVAKLFLHAGQLPSGEEPQPRAFVVGGSGNDAISVATTTTPRPSRSSDFTAQGVFKGTFAVQGGAGDDTIIGSADGDILEGGPGDDKIQGNGGDDVVAGGFGNDQLSGGSGDDFVLGGDLNAFNLGMPEPPGHDSLAGGPGADLLAPGPGSSWISGGDGPDTLLYVRGRTSGRRPPSPVRITFDDRANDGPPGKHDNVAPSVETVISVGSGFFSLAGSLTLDRGEYALRGGTALQATVTVLSGLGTVKAHHGMFTGSSFIVHPGPFRGGLTAVKPTGRNSLRGFSSCTIGSRHRRSSRTVRSLWAIADTEFRTTGKFSSATPIGAGATWETVERCDGTITIVRHGSVLLTVSLGHGRHKTVRVRAGQFQKASWHRG